MAKLSRKIGFLFNGITVDNLKFDILNNIYLIDVKKSAAPVRTRYDFIVPGRNGSQTRNNRYEDNYIDITVGIYDINIESRRIKQREFLKNFIGIKSKLIFLDEPMLFYNAEIINGVDEKEGEIFTEITIHFKASYCKYGEDKKISLTSGSEIANNAGNYKAETVTKITAVANCDSIMIENGVNSFTLQNLIVGDEIYVDSEKMIVYKYVNDVMKSAMTQFSGKFITFEPGASTVTVSGTNYSASVEIDFNDTYIV